MVNMPLDLIDRTPYHNILYEKDPADVRLATITLNRPEKLNAMCFDMILDLKHALVTAERDPEVKVITIKGAGRLFSAGYDVGIPADFGKGLAPLIAQEDDNYYHIGMRFTIWNLQKPVIAQVHGHCLGGATNLALICDITIVANDAVFAYTPVRTMSTGGGLYPWFCGMKKAKYLGLVGDPITGKEAAEIGVATMAVPAEELEERVRIVAKRLAMVPSELLSLNKFACNKSYEIMGMRAAIDVVTKIHDYGHTFEPTSEWRQKVKDVGVKAAFDWLNNKFGDDVRALGKMARERGVQFAFPQVLSMPEVKQGVLWFDAQREAQEQSGQTR
ncbi:MAG: enoyl-CoA hydratase/isomerase family protein [Chloroflexi bacterium]|nr:enoyl-CoA hydratase/isomerase family protein [Chloroflexota bacterium]